MDASWIAHYIFITVCFYKEWIPLVKSISHIGYAISFITIIFAMMAYCLVKKHKNPTNKLHMHLFSTFIMKAFMTLLKYWQYSNETIVLIWNNIDFTVEPRNKEHYILICKLFNILWNYSIIANYSWMLMEGLYLFNLVFLPIFMNTNKIIWYILLGWGLPCLVTVVWLTLHVTIANTPCWCSGDDRSTNYIITIPVITFSLTNFLLFFKIIHKLYVMQECTRYLQERKMQYRRWMKSRIILMPLFAAQFFLFIILFYFSYRNPFAVVCCQFLSSFQGTFISLAYCLLKDEIIAKMQFAWRNYWSKTGILISSILGLGKPNNRKREGNEIRHQSQSDGGTNSASIAMREL